MPGRFFDSNVILYLASDDDNKADIAETVMRDGGVVSVQVLNEIANVGRRKRSLTWPEVHELLSTVRSIFSVEPLTIDIHEAGLLLAERYRLSTYDGMIVASALAAGCDTLFSEDMHSGLVIETRLTIVDPFKSEL